MVIHKDALQSEVEGESAGVEKNQEEGTQKVNLEEVPSAEQEEEAVEEKPHKLFEIDEHIKNLKKNVAAKLLVKKAKFLVHEAENQLESCKVIFEKDLEGYEKAKKALRENGLDACESLLSQLGYVLETKSDNDESEVVFEPNEQVLPIKIQEVSTGRVSGMIMGALTAMVTLFVLVFVAMKQLGVTRDISSIPVGELAVPVLNWYGALIGLDDNPLLGGLILTALLLLIAVTVFIVKIRIQENRNLTMAKEQLIAAEEYSKHKVSCQEQMKRVDRFINKSINTLKLYQVILNEQQGKLGRILYFEKEKIGTSDFHPDSMETMKDTQELVNYIKDFMAVPMSEDGQLSGKSSLFLLRAENRIQKVIDRIY